jgi:predicted small lipoprotein YifL
MRVTRSLAVCLAGLALLATLAGCGQKGPLTLPATAASGAAR